MMVLVAARLLVRIRILEAVRIRVRIQALEAVQVPARILDMVHYVHDDDDVRDDVHDGGRDPSCGVHAQRSPPRRASLPASPLPLQELWPDS